MNKIEQLKLSEDGFTLIEMMIVVAIIAILTAIALPKFNESLAMANTSRVQADLQSLDTAIAMYKVKGVIKAMKNNANHDVFLICTPNTRLAPIRNSNAANAIAKNSANGASEVKPKAIK